MGSSGKTPHPNNAQTAPQTTPKQHPKQHPNITATGASRFPARAAALRRDDEAGGRRACQRCLTGLGGGGNPIKTLKAPHTPLRHVALWVVLSFFFSILILILILVLVLVLILILILILIHRIIVKYINIYIFLFIYLFIIDVYCFCLGGGCFICKGLHELRIINSWPEPAVIGFLWGRGGGSRGVCV